MKEKGEKRKRDQREEETKHPNGCQYRDRCDNSLAEDTRNGRGGAFHLVVGEKRRPKGIDKNILYYLLGKRREGWRNNLDVA